MYCITWNVVSCWVVTYREVYSLSPNIANLILSDIGYFGYEPKNVMPAQM